VFIVFIGIIWGCWMWALQESLMQLDMWGT